MSHAEGAEDAEKDCNSSAPPQFQAIPYSLFPIPYSLFPIPYSLFPIPYSLFPIPCSCSVIHRRRSRR
jgi:hypothetical protein